MIWKFVALLSIIGLVILWWNMYVNHIYKEIPFSKNWIIYTTTQMVIGGCIGCCIGEYINYFSI